MKILDQNGYVAIMAVLVLGAVTTAVGLTLLVTGMDAQRSSLVSQQSAQAKKLADACAEEALQRLRELNTVTGAGSLSFGNGSCAYNISVTSGLDRYITSSANVGGVIRKVEVYATIRPLSISVTSYKEVP